MDLRQSRKVQKILTLIGCMLLIFPGGLALYWGTMSVYALSFIICRLDQTSNVDIPWIISLFYITWNGSLIASNYANKLLHRRWVVLLSSIVITVAMFSSYLAIQHSLILLNITLGILIGICAGFTFGNAVQIVLEVADDDVGLLTSILQSSYSIGAFIVIQLSVWFVNPRNETPDLKLGSSTYFTQPDIIDRVPSMFLILGTFTIAVQFVGLIFLQINPSMRLFQRTPASDQLVDKKGDAKPVYNSNHRGSGCVDDNSNICNDLLEKENSSIEYTPRQMVKTAKFLALFISFAFADFPLVLLLNFYKIFGQLWIHDDHFLTIIGTAFIFITALSRIPWGYALDRFGSKRCLTVLLTSTVITVSWYYFTAMVNRWLYLFAILVYGSFAGALYSCYLVVTALVFGRTYAGTNFGIVMSSSVLFNLVAPSLIDTLLTNFGWFTTFATAGGINVVGLLLCLVYVP